MTLPAAPGVKRGRAPRDGESVGSLASEVASYEGESDVVSSSSPSSAPASSLTLLFKDLGPQIGYRAVFFWEYFGPALVYALPYLFPRVVYGLLNDSSVVDAAVARPKYPIQNLALAYVTFHYLKREIETFTVHRFSHATMPIFNLVKNCSYYWGFSLFLSYSINHPLYTPPPLLLSKVALALALFCQYANARCHLILANLRPPSGPNATKYVIPKGFWFNSITCANYTAEILGWALFTVATASFPSLLFTLAGAGQMSIWAAAKHARLRKLFDGREGREKYPKRWIMLPPFF